MGKKRAELLKRHSTSMNVLGTGRVRTVKPMEDQTTILYAELKLNSSFSSTKFIQPYPNHIFVSDIEAMKVA